jgi:sugar/nucleoside kinase (ribokinase family)
VLGIGQISLDRVWRFEGSPPAPGEPEPAGLPEYSGGQVATASLALARLGVRSSYVGAVGDDPAAAAALAPLQRAGVDCSGVKRVAGGRTRRALILVERAGGEREVRPERDPRVRLTPGDLDRARVESARALLVDTEDLEAASWAAELAGASGIPVVLDAGQPGQGAVELLAKVDFPIVSAEFAECSRGDSAREALRELASRARRLAVLTLGASGAIAQARDGDRVIESPGFRVAALDTTGAGDVFHAAFIWGLLEGLSVQAVLRAANAAAALSCRAPGAQGGLPDREALEAFLEAQATR